MISRGAGLFAEMGVGKTKITIDLAELLHRAELVKVVIVIAPLNLVEVWQDEIKIHGSNSWFIDGVGDRRHRLRNLENLQEMHDSSSTRLLWFIINVDGMKVIDKELRKLYPDLVVVDESTSIKNNRADRTKLLIDLFQSAPYKLLVSGNPTPKGSEEIFSQYRFADPGIFGNSFTRFRDRYFEVDYFNKIETFKSPVEETAERFERAFHAIAWRKKKQDCLSLPPKVYEKRYIDMTKEQAKVYAAMHAEALAAYDDLTCAAPFVITKYLRLSQIAGGIFPGMDADENKILRMFEPNPKLEGLMELIDELPKTEQVVIWARFRPEIETIYKRLTEEGHTCVKFYGGINYKDRVAARAAFKQGAARFFVGNPASGGKGLNDLIGATTVIYYSNDYSAENRQQSEDRNHRNGTIKVTYHDLLMRNTIDVEVLHVLQQNKDYSDALLDRKLQQYLSRTAQ